ncbi:unnamed protein product [Enterobius vermicularis]|uniref:PPM-type phosphatase domain-containing protein n=1 Tax=Enterobius vermicularis TaxID=51028 RepID=A0A0N4VFW8_ENTVE|nr:unnamed protein product [Enterobius vermicularis]
MRGHTCYLQVVVESSGVAGAEKRNFPINDNDIVASGVSPDDEDGDVDDGSGSPSDELEGSGRGIVKGNISLVTSPPAHATSASILNEVNIYWPYWVKQWRAGHAPSKKPFEKGPSGKPVEETNRKVDDDQRYHLPEGGRPDSRLIDDQHNILIEDSSTLRTAPPFKPSPAVYATSSAPPPAVEEEHRVYLGTLFKPGILAVGDGAHLFGAFWFARSVCSNYLSCRQVVLRNEMVRWGGSGGHAMRVQAA